MHNDDWQPQQAGSEDTEQEPPPEPQEEEGTPIVQKMLGARGRKKAARGVTREANVIRRLNKLSLRAKIDAADRTAQRFDDLPYKPEGHFSVCPGHPWSKIHHTHQPIVVYKYAGCMRCGKVSHKLNTLSGECNLTPGSAHAAAIIQKMAKGRNPYPKPWPPDNRDSRSTFPCYKLHVEARADNNKAEPFIFNRNLGDPGDFEMRAPTFTASTAIAKRKNFTSLRGKRSLASEA